MKRPLSVLLLLTLILIGGGLLIQQRSSLAALTREVEERAEAVSLAYIDIVESEAQPLLAQNLLPAQHPAATALIATNNELKKPLPLRARLQYISRVQLTVWDLVNAAAASSDTVENDPVVALKKSIGTRGAIYTLIEEYNSAAIRWNRAQERSVLSLRARLAGEEFSRLPFLRYNGEQESVSIIQL